MLFISESVGFYLFNNEYGIITCLPAIEWRLTHVGGCKFQAYIPKYLLSMCQQWERVGGDLTVA